MLIKPNFQSIEDAFVTKLNNYGIAARTLSSKKESILVTAPSVKVFLSEGNSERITNDAFNLNLTVFIVVQFRDANEETFRRHGAYPLIEGIMDLLNLEDLGLDIYPIRFIRWSDITADQDIGDNRVTFQMQFETGYALERLPENALHDIHEVVLNYFVRPGQDGRVSGGYPASSLNVTDIVELKEE